ncbi:MAG: CPBP family intramembrane metalloprotease [Candidatus Bathyarchaeota archaeon]|nr:CPBP family intramembrane metalloprotease [Candidatus Bathyarchaeota archaeon]
MNRFSLPTKRPFDWKVFLFLAVLIFLATYTIIPFAFSLQSIQLPKENLPRILILTLVDVLIVVVLAGIGLFLACRIGLGLPFIEGWIKKEQVWNRFKRMLAISIIVAVISSFVILVINQLIFVPPLLEEIKRLGIVLPESPPPWQGLLASFSAGVTEESVFRLFGLTLLVWIGSRFSSDSEGRPTLVVLWIANIIIAVSFGAAHLPLTAAIGLPLNMLVIARAIVLNGIGGLAFGWLYWTQGLESAMIAHFSVDVVLHVILVAIAPLL